jgi:hypothetical protein
LGNPPVKLVRRRRPLHADDHAALGLDHFEPDIGLAGEFCALTHVQRIAAQIVAMQK